MKHSTPYHELLHMARTFIDHHYDAPLTLERISREAGFSPYHFIRLFRLAYKRTPHQYLMQQRIEKAKVLLLTSDIPIQEVCYAVGFASLGSFSALFRRIVGLSPSSYRKWSSKRLPQPQHIPLCFRVKHGLD